MNNPSCPYQTEMYVLVDGDLSGDRRRLLEEHLETCSICRDEAEEWRQVQSALQAADPAGPLSDETRRRIHTRVFAHVHSDSAAPSPAGIRLRWSRKWSWGGGFLVSSATVACLLILLTARSAPARKLDRTLQAMAEVESAHFQGEFVYYGGTFGVDESKGRHMNVDWWYKAPDRFRRDVEPEIPDWPSPPGSTILRGNEAAFVDRHSANRGAIVPLPRSSFDEFLSPLDFFRGGGVLQRLENRTGLEIAQRDAPVGAIGLRVVLTRGNARRVWVIEVDGSTHRVLAMEASTEKKGGDGTWFPVERESLTRCEYDVPVDDRLFDIPEPGGS